MPTRRKTATERSAVTEPDTPVMAADRVYDAIYAAVVDHRLMPGSRLREEELAQTFAVSRTVVRQALHRLAQDGVITLRHNHGAMVPAPTRRDGEHVFDARRVVECEVARRLAGKLTVDQLAALRRLVDAEARATRSQNKEEAIRLSGQFHLQLAQMSGNPIFVRLLEGAHSHQQVLATLNGSTGGAAATEMRRHLNEIERSLSQPPQRTAAPLRDVFKAYKAVV